MFLTNARTQPENKYASKSPLTEAMYIELRKFYEKNDVAEIKKILLLFMTKNTHKASKSFVIKICYILKKNIN